MRSKLTQCYDYRQLAVPEELKKWRFPESQIDEELEALARDHSSEQQMEGPVKDGHSVQCTCLKDEKGNWEGRTVLLYPGRSLPGAQEAEQAVLGKRQGETFSCQLKARTLVLKVEKVVEKRTLTVGDTLVGLLGLPGVETVEDYRRWYHEKHDQAYRDKASIRICQFWLEAILRESTFDVDEAEKAAWCHHQAKTRYDALEAAGVDPKKQPDGISLTEEETMKVMEQEQEKYYLPNVIYCYFCEKDGFSVTEEDMEEMVRQMAAERKEDVEELKKQADFEIFKSVKLQEHTFHMLMREANTYLEV
ncbi:hypothetical protein [Eubacterium sp. ER2]|uniref:hypothetical protein n=1 Tax=Eubacterium sp. ER2 TaxID=1519438 RepID=UPI00051B6782|nr:hypothetical protein [Eubacterium sp. ER2]